MRNFPRAKDNISLACILNKVNIFGKTFPLFARWIRKPFSEAVKRKELEHSTKVKMLTFKTCWAMKIQLYENIFPQRQGVFLIAFGDKRNSRSSESTVSPRSARNHFNWAAENILTAFISPRHMKYSSTKMSSGMVDLIIRVAFTTEHVSTDNDRERKHKKLSSSLFSFLINGFLLISIWMFSHPWAGEGWPGNQKVRFGNSWRS